VGLTWKAAVEKNGEKMGQRLCYGLSRVLEEGIGEVSKKKLPLKERNRKRNRNLENPLGGKGRSSTERTSSASTRKKKKKVRMDIEYSIPIHSSETKMFSRKGTTPRK